MEEWRGGRWRRRGEGGEMKKEWWRRWRRVDGGEGVEERRWRSPVG